MSLLYYTTDFFCKISLERIYSLTEKIKSFRNCQLGEAVQMSFFIQRVVWYDLAISTAWKLMLGT